LHVFQDQDYSSHKVLLRQSIQ